MSEVMDADRMSRAITRIAHEILERNRGVGELALVGIRTRGVPIARRLALALKEINGEDVPTGARDSTLCRDGLTLTPVWPPPGGPPPSHPPHRDSVLHRRPQDPAGGRRALHRPDDSRRARCVD